MPKRIPPPRLPAGLASRAKWAPREARLGSRGKSGIGEQRTGGAQGQTDGGTNPASHRGVAGWPGRARLSEMKNPFYSPEPEENEPEVRCPYCSALPMEGEECKHLFIHGDDLRTETIVEDSCGAEVWLKVSASNARALPEFAVDFLERHFKRLVKIDSCGWGGVVPGLSGNYTFVWTRNRVTLQNQINDFVEGKLKKLGTAVSPNSHHSKTQARRRRSSRKKSK